VFSIEGNEYCFFGFDGVFVLYFSVMEFKFQKTWVNYIKDKGGN
jgi:hypothetical protein